MTSWLNNWRTDWLAIAVSTRLICKWLEGRAGIEIELEKCTADRRHRNDNDKALTITQKPAKPAAAAEENKMPRLRDSDDSLLSIWSRHYVAKGRHHSPRVPRRISGGKDVCTLRRVGDTFMWNWWWLKAASVGKARNYWTWQPDAHDICG